MEIIKNQDIYIDEFHRYINVKNNTKHHSITSILSGSKKNTSFKNDSTSLGTKVHNFISDNIKIRNLEEKSHFYLDVKEVGVFSNLHIDVCKEMIASLNNALKEQNIHDASFVPEKSGIYLFNDYRIGYTPDLSIKSPGNNVIVDWKIGEYNYKYLYQLAFYMLAEKADTGHLIFFNKTKLKTELITLKKNEPLMKELYEGLLKKCNFFYKETNDAENQDLLRELLGLYRTYNEELAFYKKSVNELKLKIDENLYNIKQDSKISFNKDGYTYSVKQSISSPRYSLKPEYLAECLRNFKEYLNKSQPKESYRISIKPIKNEEAV